jgi:acid phosphatase type 7
MRIMRMLMLQYIQDGWMDPGIFHAVVLKGLTPGQRYFYKYGSPETGEYSDEFDFLAAPAVGTAVEVKALLLADMGQAEEDGSFEQSEMRPSLNTSRLMISDAATGEYGLVGHFGDISYARGHVSQWDRCGRPALSSHPCHPLRV